jgi:hypothetical protein
MGIFEMCSFRTWTSVGMFYKMATLYTYVFKKYHINTKTYYLGIGYAMNVTKNMCVKDEGKYGQQGKEEL